MAHYTVRQEEVFMGADEGDPRSLMEIGDDEFVLDAEYRGSNRVVVAVATPVEVEYNCGYNGCSRTVENPQDRCWQHDEVDEE